MCLPLGYRREGEPLPTNAICKLHKLLYNLKQASQQCFSKFSIVLLDNGFQQLVVDNSLFTPNLVELLFFLFWSMWMT